MVTLDTIYTIEIKMRLFRYTVLLTSFFLTSFVNAEIILQDLQGKNIAFSSLSGKWVFINYWASWCQLCIDEIPELNNFYAQHKTANVALFAVNYDMLPIDEQQKLIKTFNIRYPALNKDSAEGLNLGDIQGVPATFIFNPQGKLVNTLYGRQTATSLEKFIF